MCSSNKVKRTWLSEKEEQGNKQLKTKKCLNERKFNSDWTNLSFKTNSQTKQDHGIVWSYSTSNHFSLKQLFELNYFTLPGCFLNLTKILCCLTVAAEWKRWTTVTTYLADLLRKTLLRAAAVLFACWPDCNVLLSPCYCVSSPMCGQMLTCLETNTHTPCHVSSWKSYI